MITERSGLVFPLIRHIILKIGAVSLDEKYRKVNLKVDFKKYVG